jgi:hypothetical protein
MNSRKSERGSTIVMMSLSIAVLVMFFSGLVVFGTAFVTSSGMLEADQVSGEYTHLVETQDAFEVTTADGVVVGVMVGSQASE